MEAWCANDRHDWLSGYVYSSSRVSLSSSLLNLLNLLYVIGFSLLARLVPSLLCLVPITFYYRLGLPCKSLITTRQLLGDFSFCDLSGSRCQGPSVMTLAGYRQIFMGKSTRCESRRARRRSN